MWASPRRIVLLFMVGVLLSGASVVLASPAAAATGTLTVTTLDRTGRAVRTQYGAVSVNTGDQHYFSTGGAHRLPRGTYDVYAAISSLNDGTETVGVKRVRIAGAARVIIDGAWSTTIRNPASGYVSLRANVLDTHGNAATTKVLRAYAIG